MNNTTATLIRIIKRSSLARLIYASLFSRKKLRWFLLSIWVQYGYRLLQKCGIDHITLTSENKAWVRLPSGISVSYMDIAAGEVLDGTVYQGTYEDHLWNTIQSRLPDNGVFFDIGANIGWYSLHAACLSKARVFAFEPGKTALQYLKRNILLNGLSENITLTEKVVGLEDETCHFSNDTVGHALNHVLTEGEVGINSCDLQSVSIDKFVSDHQISRIDLIKCDIEGGELKFLQGAHNTIQRFHPLLLLEVNSNWCKRQGYSPQEIHELLDALDYEYQVISSKGKFICTYDFHTDLQKGENVLFSLRKKT